MAREGNGGAKVALSAQEPEAEGGRMTGYCRRVVPFPAGEACLSAGADEIRCSLEEKVGESVVTGEPEDCGESLPSGIFGLDLGEVVEEPSDLEEAGRALRGNAEYEARLFVSRVFLTITVPVVFADEREFSESLDDG